MKFLFILILLLVLGGCYISSADRNRILNLDIDEEWDDFVDENSDKMPIEDDPEIIVYRSGYNTTYNETS